MYLTGFCLFLSLVLTRTFAIVLDLIQTQEDYAKLKKAASIQLTSFVSPFENAYPLDGDHLQEQHCIQ